MIPGSPMLPIPINFMLRYVMLLIVKLPLGAKTIGSFFEASAPTGVYVFYKARLDEWPDMNSNRSDVGLGGFGFVFSQPIDHGWASSIHFFSSVMTIR